MKIGDRVFVRGYIDEIRKDTVIVRNDGGYFGTTWNEVTPSAQPKKGKCKWCERLKERNLRIEYYWIDQEGCTASFSEPHIVATGIANFCPNCGADMRSENEE